jgi:hypothetical protein
MRETHTSSDLISLGSPRLIFAKFWALILVCWLRTYPASIKSGLLCDMFICMHVCRTSNSIVWYLRKRPIWNWRSFSFVLRTDHDRTSSRLDRRTRSFPWIRKPIPAGSLDNRELWFFFLSEVATSEITGLRRSRGFDDWREVGGPLPEISSSKRPWRCSSSRKLSDLLMTVLLPH